MHRQNALQPGRDGDLQSLVHGPCPLDDAEELQSLAMMWIQDVTLFGDREAASNIGHKHWAWQYPGMHILSLYHYVFLFAPVSGLICTLELTTLGWSRAVRRLAFDRKQIWYLLVRIKFLNALCFSQIDLCAQQHSHQCALARGPVANILTRLHRLTLQAIVRVVGDVDLEPAEEICLAAESCSYTVIYYKHPPAALQFRKLSAITPRHSSGQGSTGRLDSPLESMA
ncbi:hypothetical protein B0H14DRAFT_2627190 [Mycena olivaceomarginata]|nr:hypothetical protein B0H14DRAFT_2627190 [Mycena olivaceomarginata]